MLPKVIDNYKATLVGNYTPTDTAITVSVAPTVITEGYLTVFDFDGNQLEKIKFTNVTGSVLTCIRGLSFTTFSDTPVVGNAKDLQNGMYVKLSMSLSYLNSIIDQLQGTTALDGIPKLSASRIISDSNHLVDKAYADAIGVAGITGFLVSSAAGKTVNIGAGTYTKNGEVLTYAGASGTVVATGNNYIEFKDGAISINQTAFTNDAYPLALVVCNASAITSNTDKRSFINITDLRTNTNGTLLTGAVIAGMRVYTGWTGITNGSFRAAIDGVAWNFDAINFSTATSMTDVATLIQTKIRAITGATETVSYNATDYKFTITSSTTGTESQISVLSTSTGTVGTDISGANYLNGASGTATQGTGNFIDRDSTGLFGKIGQGLKIIAGYLLPKLKTNGGILSGADGLYVDTGTTDGKIVQMTTGDKLPAVDGSNLTSLTTPMQQATASDVLKYSADTERTFANGSPYTLKKAISVRRPGTYRVKFDLKSSSSGSVKGKIYVNGIAVGTERTTTGTTYVTYSEDIPITFTQLSSGSVDIQLYIQSNVNAGNDAIYRNFRLYFDVTNLVDGVVITD